MTPHFICFRQKMRTLKVYDDLGMMQDQFRPRFLKDNSLEISTEILHEHGLYGMFAGCFLRAGADASRGGGAMSYIKASTSRIEDATEKLLVWICSMNRIAQQFWSVLGTLPHGFCQVRSLL
jgi:hypothetical protein